MSPAAIMMTVLSTLLYLCCHLASANPDAKRLYDDLLKKKKYNKLMRPVANHKDNLTVYMNLKLSQLIDVVSTLHVVSSTCIRTFSSYLSPQ